MGGKRKGSVLKKKVADWWWRQELSPHMAAILNEIQVKANYRKWQEVEEYLKKLEEEVRDVVKDSSAVRLRIVKMYGEEEREFSRKAFYEVLYPLVLEYRFMPLQAMFIWYLRGLKLVFRVKPPVDLLNPLRGWIKMWLSGGCTKEVEERVKASMVSWMVSKY
jgi:hypothetical protein